MRRRIGAVIVAILALLASAPTASGADAETSKATLRLVKQTPWLAAGGTFDVELAAGGLSDIAGLDLVATLHSAVGTRSAFAQALTGTRLGAVRSQKTIALASLPNAAAGIVSLSLPLPRLDTASGELTLPALDRGVYPMTFVVRPRGGGTVQASLTTYLVRLPDATSGVPLDVAWVQPVSAAPTATATPTKRLADADRAALSTLLARLAANPLVPVSLDLTPDTVAALGPADLLTLRSLLDDRHPVFAAPYVDIDPTAVVGADRADDLARQRQTGEDVLLAAIGTRGDHRTWSIERPLSTDALDRLRAIGATRLVLPESTLRPLRELTRTLTNPYMLDAGSGDVVEAVSADEGFAAHFPSDDDDPVLAAHALLADLAVVSRDAPSAPHGVVVRPPASWRPSAAFLDVVLPALANTPILTPVTLDRLFTDVPLYRPATNANVATRTLSTTARLGSLPTARLAQAQATVDQLTTLVGPANEQATGVRRLFLAAESERLSTRQRTALLDELDAALERVRGNIRLPNDRTYRLTARSGTIPLSIANTNPFELHVDIVLSSDKLEFTDVHAEDRSRLVLAGVVLPANGRLTRAIPVKARASATFSMQAEVNAPTGQALGRSRLTIISTAFSGVGVVLSIGAALFLALWWLRHWRSARRDRLAGTAR